MVIEEISVQNPLCILHLVIVSFGLSRIIPVACVIVCVQYPIPHTNPTKFMLAFGALHMIASAVFLNGAGTIRAVFCVGHKPVRRFCVILALLIPLFDHVT